MNSRVLNVFCGTASLNELFPVTKQLILYGYKIRLTHVLLGMQEGQQLLGSVGYAKLNEGADCESVTVAGKVLVKQLSSFLGWLASTKDYSIT